LLIKQKSGSREWMSKQRTPRQTPTLPWPRSCLNSAQTHTYLLLGRGGGSDGCRLLLKRMLVVVLEERHKRSFQFWRPWYAQKSCVLSPQCFALFRRFAHAWSRGDLWHRTRGWHVVRCNSWVICQRRPFAKPSPRSSARCKADNVLQIPYLAPILAHGVQRSVECS
jgi:hypothetical protein